VVAGDDRAARATVTGLIGEFGFDVVELFALPEGWRIQRDTPGYVQRDDADQLREHLAAAKRYRDM
jgi:predicted dinucleotide-binding enzyme